MKILISIFVLTLLIQTFVHYVKGTKSNILACGLLAYSGNVPFNPMAIKMLFFFNEDRGKHSCGSYNHKLHVDHTLARIYKRSGMVSKTYIPDANITPTNLFIGHTRHATMGNSHDLAGAHPFNFTNKQTKREVVGAHNGIIDNYELLLKEYEYNKSDCSIDSMVFIKYLADNDDYKVLEDFDGKAALIWTDPEDENKLHFYRNTHRPLFRGTIKEGEGVNETIQMYFSSIEPSLAAIGCDDIKEVPTDKVFTVENGVISDNPVKIVSKPVEKEVILIEPAPSGECRRAIQWSTTTDSTIIFDITKYNDGSMDKIRKDPTFARRRVNETILIDKERGYKVLRQEFNDGGFQEVFLHKLGEESSGDSEDTIDTLSYIAEVYEQLDEVKTKLREFFLENQIDDEKFDLSDLDKIIVNMETFSSSVSEPSEC